MDERCGLFIQAQLLGAPCSRPDNFAASGKTAARPILRLQIIHPGVTSL
jgi:hypothetical protein